MAAASAAGRDGRGTRRWFPSPLGRATFRTHPFRVSRTLSAMHVHGTPYRTIWMDEGVVRLIDQNRLPFEFAIADCRTHRDTARAIREMVVRGAPAIGAAGAFAVAQAFAEAPAGDPW